MAGKSINRSIRIFINGNEVEHSLNNVRKEMNRLQREVNGLERGTADYVKKSAELRKVSAYYREMRQEITGLPTLFQRLSESAKGMVAIFGVGLGLSGLFSQFRRLMEMSAELSDLQSNVRKTTGMNRKEVEDLTKALDELETRTSRADLLAIAEEGGRLGLPKEDILAFTEAMDKANVALGDVFASASDVASVLGKLRGLYQETREMEVGEAYNRIGSALNELGAAGQASEKNIAEFATGVGALPNAFKPSISQALALGAAFEESGIDAKVASRSYSTLIQTAAKDTEIFAKLMGISKEEIENLINTDPVEFFLQFTQSMSQLDKDGVKTAKALNKLGIGADGVNKIIGAGAAANERFRRTLALSAEALEEGTSLTNEFNVKNENLAATIEKINKHFVELMSSDGVVAFIEDLVNWFARLIGAVDQSEKETSTFVKVLDFAARAFGVLIASLVSYHAAARLAVLLTNSQTKAFGLNALATKGATFAQNVWTAAIMTGSAIINTFQGNVGRAAAATRVLNTVIRANPFGLAFAAITALVSAIVIFTRESKKAAEQQKRFGEMMAEANKKAREGISETINQIDSLINVIKDEQISLETRKKAYQELIKIAPEFNGFLEDEKFNIVGLTAVYKAYIAQLYKLAEAKAIIAMTDQTSSEVVSAQLDLFSIEKRLANAKAELQKLEDQELAFERAPVYGKGSGAIIAWVDKETQAYREQKKAVSELEKQRKTLNDTLNTSIKNQEESKDFTEAAIKQIDAEIELTKRRIEEYKKIDSEFAETIVKNNERELRYLEQRRNVLLGGSGATGSEPGGPSINLDGDEDDKAAKKLKAHMEKIWTDILATEKEKNDELRKVQRQARDERIALMDEGYEKEVQKLEAQNDDRKEDLRVEIEARNQLIRELNKKASEERSHGHLKEAFEYSRLAKEQVKINDEKNELIILSDQTTAAKRKTLWLDFQTKAFEAKKKEVEDQQKQYERELTNLQTRHNEELKSIQTLEEAKAILRDRYGYSEDELSKVRTFAKAKSEIELAQSKETYELQAGQLQSQITKLNELLKADELLSGTAFGALFSDEQRDAIIEWIERLRNELSKIDNPDEDPDVAAENKKLGSFIDIFGFTADEWESAFQNLDTMSDKLKLAQMGVQAMTNAWNMFFQSQQRNMQRDMQAFTESTNRKKEALSKQLEQGYISQEVYNAKVAKLDADLEKKKAQMEYKSAMAEWKQSLLQAGTNTALGITSALAMTPPNFVIAAIVGAMGAVQAGLIAANKPKKPQGYFLGGETGGSGNYDERGRELADGPLHANEYVIPEWLRRDPQVARIEGFIEARRRGGNPNLHGHDKNDSDGRLGASQKPESAEKETATQLALLSAINRLNDNLEYMQDHPFEAKMTRTMEVAKYISDDLEAFNNHRQKNKR